MLKSIIRVEKPFRFLVFAATLAICIIRFCRTEPLKRRYGGWGITMMANILILVARGPQPVPGFREQRYISQNLNPFSTRFYAPGSWQGLYPASLLFAANVLKSAGLFDLACKTYERLRLTGFERELVETGLGDMFLIEAGWTLEVQECRASAIMIEPDLASNIGGFSPAWTMRSFEEATAVLRSAAEELNPKSSMAWWLFACALLKSGEHNAASVALAKFRGLAPPLNEQHMAEIHAAYGCDRGKGRLASERNLGRWYGWFAVTDADLFDGGPLTSPTGVGIKNFAGEAKLRLQCEVVAGGETAFYRRDLSFRESYAYDIEDAEILPSYGMVLAAGKILISQTAHVPQSHWRLYTLPIAAVRDTSALIVRPVPSLIPIENAIFFGSNTNYYHFLCEDLPRLLLYEKQFGKCSQQPLLVDHRIPQWQQEILVQLGIEASRWRCVNLSEPIRLRRLHVPGLLSRDLLVHPAATGVVRKRMALSAGDAASTRGKRYYLSRRAGGSRNASFMNENEVWTKFAGAGFKYVDTGKLTVREQVNLFADAEVIAGPAGAALANILFAPCDCRVLVLASHAAAGETFSSLAASIGQSYTICLGESYPRPHREWIHTNVDFYINPKDVDLALARVCNP